MITALAPLQARMRAVFLNACWIGFYYGTFALLSAASEIFVPQGLPQFNHTWGNACFIFLSLVPWLSQLVWEGSYGATPGQALLHLESHTPHTGFKGALRKTGRRLTFYLASLLFFMAIAWGFFAHPVLWLLCVLLIWACAGYFCIKCGARLPDLLFDTQTRASSLPMPRRWLGLNLLIWGGLLWLGVMMSANHLNFSPKTQSSVKTNAHTLQTAIETYGVDHGGRYPSDLQALKRAAQQDNYWKELNNPYPAQGAVFMRQEPLAASLDANDETFPGAVRYEVTDQGNCYRLQAYDERGQRLMDSEGTRPFELNCH